MVANNCRNSHSNLNLNEIHSIANPFSNYCTHNYNTTKKNHRLVIQPISYFFPVIRRIYFWRLEDWVSEWLLRIQRSDWYLLRRIWAWCVNAFQFWRLVLTLALLLHYLLLRIDLTKVTLTCYSLKQKKH